MPTTARTENIQIQIASVWTDTFELIDLILCLCICIVYSVLVNLKPTYESKKKKNNEQILTTQPKQSTELKLNEENNNQQAINKNLLHDWFWFFFSFLFFVFHINCNELSIDNKYE